MRIALRLLTSLPYQQKKPTGFRRGLRRHFRNSVLAVQVDYRYTKGRHERRPTLSYIALMQHSRQGLLLSSPQFGHHAANVVASLSATGRMMRAALKPAVAGSVAAGAA